jgi:inner membrane protein
MMWWLWLLFGLVLLVVEMSTPSGLYVLFFGLAALVVGVLAALGVEPAWLQWLAFGGISVLSLLFFRGMLVRRLKRTSSPTADVDSIVGEFATLSDDLEGHGTGRAAMRGTEWNVTNASGEPLSKGQRCRVERVEGITLFVRPG